MPARKCLLILAGLSVGTIYWFGETISLKKLFTEAVGYHLVFTSYFVLDNR